MIEIIHGLPGYVTAFRATGKVTRDDYLTIINPRVKTAINTFGKVNYLLVLNTKLGNYTAGAWAEDVLLGFKYFTRLKKLAIVTERDQIKKFTDIFGKLIPPDTRGFKMEDLSVAKQWISGL
ncbi:MAG: STAS/SEC14 domain-containing protein [Ginsengibacter sp.]